MINNYIYKLTTGEQMSTYKMNIEQIKETVKRDGILLRFVPFNQRTLEICKLAVSRNGCALQFVPPLFRTDKVCEMAVRQDGYALHFVPNHLRTEKLRAIATRTYLFTIKDQPDADSEQG